MQALEFSQPQSSIPSTLQESPSGKLPARVANHSHLRISGKKTSIAASGVEVGLPVSVTVAVGDEV